MVLAHDPLLNETYVSNEKGDIIKITNNDSWFFISIQKWNLIKDGNHLINKDTFQRHALITKRLEDIFAIEGLRYAGTRCKIS